MSETTQKAQEGVTGAARALPDSTSALVRHEIAVAEREMLAKAKESLPAIGLLGAASMFGAASAAAVYRLSVRLLEKSLPPATAASVAAVGYGVAAGAAGTIGLRRLRGSRPLIPADTVREIVKTTTDTAKKVADTTASAATDTAQKVADTAQRVAGPTAKAAAGTAEKAARTTTKTATGTAKKAAGVTRDTARKAAGATKDPAEDTAATARPKSRRRPSTPKQSDSETS